MQIDQEFRRLTSPFGKVALHAVLGVGAVLASAGSAQADVTPPAYDAHNCVAVSKDFDTTKTLNRTVNGMITNTSGSTMILHCPIVRTTVGPGQMDDRFVSASIPVVTNGFTAVTCNANIWSALIPTNSDEPTNLVPVFASGTSTTNIVITGGTSPVDYWDGGGAPMSPPKWLYMDLTCTVPNGASLKNYKITEGGTDHGYRIYPSVSCREDSTNNMLWQYLDGSNANQIGGMMRGQAATGFTNYAMRCPAPNNDRIEFSTSSSGTHPIGCNLNTTNLTTPHWAAPTSPIDASWPSQILPSSSTDPSIPFIAIPSSGQNNLICGIDAPLGDGHLVSYRVTPPNRGSWVVSSSTGGAVGNVKDNNASTRWTTTKNGQGTPGLSGMSFTVDFGTVKPWTQVTMDSATSTNDFARGYRIDASSDGASWNTMATGTGTNAFVVNKSGVHFSRFVRIVLTQDLPTGQWWSLHELNIY